MLKEIGIQLKHSILFVALFTILAGFLYPLAMTLCGRVFFPKQASGSLVTMNEKTMGSELIGQPFGDVKYFWGRPSATSPFPYNAADSSGSNWGPTNPDLLNAVKIRVEALRKADPEQAGRPVPMDLVTASASGLDPEISPEGAQYQAARVAKDRKIPLEAVEKLIRENTRPRWLGFIGDPGVNVLELNLALDSLKPGKP
jgi:potassium-transporting ATPase KdpC subunit